MSAAPGHRSVFRGLAALAGICGPLLAALLLPAPAAAEIQISAALSAESAGAGESVTYSILAAGGGFDSLAFEPSIRLENFDFVAGPFMAEHVEFVNGTLSRSYRVSWELRPHAPGKARVHASIRLNGQVKELPLRELAVAAAADAAPAPQAPGDPNAGAGAPGGGGSGEADDPFGRVFGSDSPLRRFFEPPRPRPSTPLVFLRAEVTPPHPWVGQQALWTLYLYTREDINAINQEGVPSFHGFWAKEVPQPQNLPHDMVDVDGQRFARVPLMRKALFALHSGPIAIDPVEVELMVRPPQSGFWGATLDAPEPVRLRAPAVVVDSRPLPAPPAGFAGAVGRVTLHASLAPSDLRLGEAATLTVTLAGDGHLSGVPAPELALPSGLKLLPPQQQGEDALAGTTVRGQRTWSFAVIPERTGSYRFAVPPVPYFDPQSGAYRLASATPFELTARSAPPPSTAAAPTAISRAIAAATPGPAGGNLLGGAAWERARRALPTVLPWLLALPLGAAAFVALARRRSPAAVLAAAAAAGPGAAGARARAEGHLAAAAGEERPRQVAVEIEAAVGELLGERWGVPAATPPRQWRVLALARGADADVAADLGRLADDLHYLRYAPQLSAIGPLKAEALASGRRLLRRLR